MHIRNLYLRHFRNYDELSLEFSPRINLITGMNGHGKTNLLEAVHYLCLAHSPRTRKDKELIRWEAPSFTLRLEGESQSGNHALGAQYTESGEKRVKVDGVESRRLSDLIGAFPLVSFSPDDIDVVRGSPALRRRFLDVLLCQYSPEYLENLRRYTQALKQRNNLLKNRHQPDETLLEVYGEQLATSGSVLTLLRKDLLKRFSAAAQACYALIGGGQEAFSLALECPYSQADDWEGLRRDFFRKMAEIRSQERLQGTSLIGPHREDLLLFLNEKRVREFGSQGQKRSVALSLKMAAVRVLEEKYSEPPILLLDDVFAELDETRRARIGDILSSKGQVFIASPNPAELPFSVQKSIRMRFGKVEVEEADS